MPRENAGRAFEKSLVRPARRVEGLFKLAGLQNWSRTLSRKISTLTDFFLFVAVSSFPAL